MSEQLTLPTRTFALTLDRRLQSQILYDRLFALTLDTRSDIYLPSLMLLEDGSGYWLFEDGSRIMWEAGNTGLSFSPLPRTIALTVDNR